MAQENYKSEDIAHLISFWFIKVEDVHPTHFLTLSFENEATDKLFEQTRNFLLSMPRAARYFVQKLCEKWHLTPPLTHEDFWHKLNPSTQQIFLLSPQSLESQVILPLGCVIMSERVLNTLSGDEVRQFEASLGKKLCAVLAHFGTLSSYAQERMPFAALRLIKHDRFLVEARKIGLSYFLAACCLLESVIALRVMLKLENKQAFFEEKEKRPIVFHDHEKQRVWSFIQSVWKEVGLTCFVS